VLPLLGQNLLSGEEASLTCRAVASARTVAAYASAHLLQAIITHACGAVMELYAACPRAEHSDAPPSDQAGLLWCQFTCPVCQWQAILLTWAHPAHLPAFNTVVGLESCGSTSATGTWQGQPRTYHGGSMWRHRTPSRGKGGSGAPWPVGAVRPVEVWPPRVAAPDLPGESGSVGATREHPCPHGHVEARTYKSTGEVRRP
jgi:hypothetical protein